MLQFGMRTFSVALLAFLFAWNSLLGGLDVLVLCFHREGNVHFEMVGKNGHLADGWCLGSEVSIAGLDCMSCTDWMLESSDLGPTRTQDLESIKVPAPTVLVSRAPRCEEVIRQGLEVAVFHEAKAPPNMEPASEMIGRTIVLRL